jgi:hypothetical protein
MQKWTYFTMGIMAGLILLLGGALLVQGREPTAFAMQSVDNQGKYVMGIGGSAQGLNDMVWVLHEHPPLPGLKPRGEEDDTRIQKGNRVSLCLYQIAENGRKMKLVSVRDIAYDVEIIDFMSEPPVRDIIATLKKNLKKD